MGRLVGGRGEVRQFKRGEKKRVREEGYRRVYGRDERVEREALKVACSGKRKNAAHQVPVSS